MFPIDPPNILERIELDKTNKANSHAIATLNNDVNRLVKSVKELTNIIDGLLTRLQEVEQRVNQFERDSND